MKNFYLHKTGFVGVVLLLTFAALALISSKNKLTISKKNIADTPGHIVLMELFTSQGCSSCPPADLLLGEYAATHDTHIFPLSFHVDYWNRLGWADPFSSSDYSARQQYYSRYHPQHSVYTPQLVVNGKSETVGNNRNTVKKLVAQQLSVKQTEFVSIEDVITGKNSVTFHYKVSGNSPDEVLNIALVQKQVTTKIKAGENAGVSVTNHNIVRSFITQPLGNNGTGLISLPPLFKADEYALIVYVQNTMDLAIHAAAMKEL